MSVSLNRLTNSSVTIELGAAKRGRKHPRLNVQSVLRTSALWQGWVTLQHAAGTTAAGHLETHADWIGPIKLVCDALHSQAAPMRQTTFYINRQADPEMGGFQFDDELLEQQQRLFRQLSSSIVAWNRQAIPTDWSGPDALQMVAWLRAAGYEAVIDERDDIRFTLHRPGGSGQVRVSREDGRLRFVLPLGRWRDLSAEAATAMQEHARRANRNTRLARVVWKADTDKGTSCEAQIDLTGMPWGDPTGTCQIEFWAQLVGCAARSLEAILHRTTAELAALADTRNLALARDLLAITTR